MRTVYRASRLVEFDCRARVGAQVRTRGRTLFDCLSFLGKNVSNLAEISGCNGTILPKNE